MRKAWTVAAAGLALAIAAVDPGVAAESFDSVDRSTFTRPGSGNAVVAAASDISGGGAFSMSVSLDEPDMKLDTDYGFASSNVRAVKRVTLAPGSYTAKSTLSGLTGSVTNSGTGGAGASVWLNLDCDVCSPTSSQTLHIIGTGSPLRDTSVSNGTITAVMNFTVPEEAGPTTVGVVTLVNGGASAMNGVAGGPEPSYAIWVHGGGSAAMQLTGVVDRVVVEPTPAS